jgi:hypothetical protein
MIGIIENKTGEYYQAKSNCCKVDIKLVIYNEETKTLICSKCYKTPTIILKK